MVYINKGDHENPQGLPKCNSVGLQDSVKHEYAHIDVPPQMPEEVEKLEYICDVVHHLGMCLHDYGCSPLLKTFVNC